MTKKQYRDKIGIYYNMPVSYKIVELGDPDNVIMINTTFNMSTVLENMMSDAIDGCKEKGLNGIAGHYDNLRKQMWEQDKVNGYDDIMREINFLILLEKNDDEAHEE